MGHSRALVLAVAAVTALAAGCKKKRAKRVAVGPPPAGAPADPVGLWGLAPPGTSFGVVVTAPAVQHLERAVVAVDDLITATRELAPVAASMHAELRRIGVERPSLAALGLAGDQGAALFVTDRGAVAVLPVRDRGRLLERLGGEPGGDTDRIGDWTCRVVRGAYACSPVAALLGELGNGRPPPGLERMGEHGDIELAGLIPDAGWGPVAVAIDTRPGAVSLRAVLAGFRPGQLAALANGRSQVEPTTAAFALLAMPSLMRTIPSQPLTPGVTMAGLADALAGPLVMTVSAGAAPAFDGRIALRDPELVRGLVGQCDTVAMLRAAGAVAEDGVCKVPVAQVAGTAEVWVDGDTLHIGRRDRRPDGTVASLTELGRDIAGGEWLVAAYGRGSTLALADEAGLLAGQLPANAVLVARLARLLSELGLAGRVDGDTIRVVAGLRTIWDNPDQVVAELLAIEAGRSGDGVAVEALADVARRAPGSPFAGDLAAGGQPLMLPVAVLGLVASIAIPAYVSAARRASD